MKKTQLIFTVILVLIGAGALAYKFFAVSKDPDFDKIVLQKDKNTQEVSLASLQGKATIIAFFQTWCGDCIREIPTLIALQNSLQSPLLKIILVTDEPEEKLAYFKTKFPAFQLDYFYSPISLKKLGIQKYPTTYLIDANGKIMLKTLEGYDWNSTQSKELITKMIAK